MFKDGIMADPDSFFIVGALTIIFIVGAIAIVGAIFGGSGRKKNGGKQ